jgi:hypothetical protein
MRLPCTARRGERASGAGQLIEARPGHVAFLTALPSGSVRGPVAAFEAPAGKKFAASRLHLPAIVQLLWQAD